MSVTPTNYEALSLDALRDLISNCTTFQTWTSTASAALAKAKIGVKARDSDSGTGDMSRPFAVVSELEHEYPPNAFPRGSHALLFEGAVGSGNSAHADAHFEFMSNVAGIVSEMRGLGNAPGYLCIRSIKKVGPQQRADVTEHTDYLQSFWEIEWGLN